MLPAIKILGLTAIVTGVVIGVLTKLNENKEKEKVVYQNVRTTASKFQDDDIDDDDTEEEEEEIYFENDYDEEGIEYEEEPNNITPGEYEMTAQRNNEEEEYLPPSSSDGETIGIDLGTNSCCIGVWQNGRVQIINNENGNSTTPSYVSFTEIGVETGDTPKLQAIMNAQNTVFNTKRLIGRKFTDHGVQADIDHWPFAVRKGSEDVPTIQVDYDGTKRNFKAEDISCMILIKMKMLAEAYLQKPVTNAVLTVPAHFNHCQRQATRNAGSRAGLNVRRIMNETTAAAIAYGAPDDGTSDEPKDDDQDEKIILVFDLGAASLTVSLLTIEDGIFEVEATASNSRLGGDDFDNCLVSYVLAQMTRQLGKDFSNNQQVLLHVRAECERVKRMLSSSTEETIEVCPLCEGIYFKSTITRTQLEELCMDYFTRCMDPVEEVLDDVGTRISKADIDEVVLVGGSTRIPKIQKLLTDLFNGKELCRSVNPDEAVAYGATIQAAMLSDEDSPEKLAGPDCIDITPFSLGLEIDGGEMTTMIKRKTAFPFEESTIFTTAADRNSSSVLIKVFEGESSLTCNNNFLGELRLDGIPSSGMPEINVCFKIDIDGILSVSAIEKSTGKKKTLIMKGTPMRVNTGYASNVATLIKYNPL